MVYYLMFNAVVASTRLPTKQNKPILMPSDVTAEMEKAPMPVIFASFLLADCFDAAFESVVELQSNT